jgi:two-component system phosphate regulon sensor histidine kinase PhoR
MRGRTALLLLVLAGLLLAALLLPAPLLRAIERAERGQLAQHWQVTLDLVLVRSRSAADPEQLADQLAQVSGAAVLLSAADGRAFSAPPDSRSLFGTGPEVERARRSGFAWDQRPPASDQPSWLYLARSAPDGSGIRAALPLAALERADARRAAMAYGFSLLIAALLALALILIERAQRRAERSLATQLRRLAEQDQPLLQPPATRWSAELEQIGRASLRVAERIELQRGFLAQEVERLQTILDSMAEGVLAVDAAGRVLMSNKSLRELLEAGPNETAQEHYLQLVRHRVLAEALEYCLRTGSEFNKRISFDALQERSFELQVRPVKVGGGRGAVAVLVEVTRLEKLQTIRQRFLADASHELRTPLTAIRSLAETLADTDLEDPAAARSSLERLLKHCDRIESLLRDITDLSKIESGAVVLHPESVPLRPVFEELVRLFQTNLYQRRIEVALEVEPEAALYADRQRLEQILINLVDNAIKFNRDGGRLRLAHRSGPTVDRIEIEDSGIGIPLDQREQIFHRFYRVPRPYEEGARGTGLGLAIVRHLVQLHGGSITVESELGRGSRFTITLPKLGAASP